MSVGSRVQPDAGFSGFSEDLERGRGWSSPLILSHRWRSRPSTDQAISVLLVPSRVSGFPAYTLWPRDPDWLEMVTKRTAPVTWRWFFARCTWRTERPEKSANFWSSKWIHPVLDDFDQRRRRYPRRRAAEGGWRWRRGRRGPPPVGPGDSTNWMLARFDRPVWRPKCHPLEGKQTCRIQEWMLRSSSGN